VQEAKHLEMIYEFSHQQVLYQEAMQAAQLGLAPIGRIEALAGNARLTQQRKRSLLHSLSKFSRSESKLESKSATGRDEAVVLPPTTMTTMRREAFATVLWTVDGSLPAFEAYLEVVLVLALRLVSVSLKPRPFLVLVPEDTPDQFLRKLRQFSSLVRPRRVLGLKAFLPGGFTNLPGEVGPVYDWPKLLLWTLTEFESIVYLDADTLPLERGCLERVFQAVEQGSPFAAAAFGANSEVNNGVFALEPSEAVFACMHFHATNGTFWGTPEFELRGSTWQAFLDLFWLHFSQRFKLWNGEVSHWPGQGTLQCPESTGSRSKGPTVAGALNEEEEEEEDEEGFGAQKAAAAQSDIMRLRPPHLLLPAIFNFPCSFVGVARKGQESLETVAARWTEDLVQGNIAVFHWVGAARKPWLHWSPAARSPFDREWWRAHRALCQFLRRRGRIETFLERWQLAGRRLPVTRWQCRLLCTPVCS